MSRKRKDEITEGRVYKPRYRDRKDPSIIREYKCYWIQFYHHGQRRKPATDLNGKRTDNYFEAVRCLNRELEAAKAGKILPMDAERMRFSDLTQLVVRDYRRNKRRSLERAEDAIVHLTSYFGFTRPADIDFAAIDGYVDYRMETDGAANATVKYELAILKRGFSLAHETLGKMPKFPTVSTENVRTGFFEEEEFVVFLEKFDRELQPAIKFGYLTGWRIKAEIFPLTWPHVDFRAGEVRLEPGTTKNKEGRTIPFAILPELGEILQAQREYTDQVQRDRNMIVPWVFHRNGARIRDIRGAWARALEESKISHKIPHDFRRTAVRNLERAGVPRSVAMKLVGHKTEAIYRRYAIVGKNDLVDGYKRYADFRESVKGEETKVVPIKPKEDAG